MGEYEPNDSRNVTGTATTPDGRWTNTEGKTPPGVIADPGKPKSKDVETAGPDDAPKVNVDGEQGGSRPTPPPG